MGLVATYNIKLVPAVLAIPVNRDWHSVLGVELLGYLQRHTNAAVTSDGATHSECLGLEVYRGEHLPILALAASP